MKLEFPLVRAAASLTHMVTEMRRKGLELKRMTKAAALLSRSGFFSPGGFAPLVQDCVAAQYLDGGWVSVVDTFWNLVFLREVSSDVFQEVFPQAKVYLERNQGVSGIWGRSVRDFERIPVSGPILCFLPEFATAARLLALENLWVKEFGSLVYKAAYTLMAFQATGYAPKRAGLVDETLDWLISNQREDGSFAPWKTHPAASDTYCTSLALLGLLAYHERIDRHILISAVNWLFATQLPTGIWPFHEIEDGAGWALFALATARRAGVFE